MKSLAPARPINSRTASLVVDVLAARLSMNSLPTICAVSANHADTDSSRRVMSVKCATAQRIRGSAQLFLNTWIEWKFRSRSG